MGRDKALLELGGEPLVVRAGRLLEPMTREVLVSVRDATQPLPDAARWRRVVDDPRLGGPAAGLLAAWHAVPGEALLVLAVDMPLVDAALLDRLSRRRNVAAPATAFVRAEVPEPLCAIWEPRAAGIVRARIDRGGSASLRRVLLEERAELVADARVERLVSINSWEEYQAVKELFGEGA
jgi:molybdopterin-guanine dinucleotide biosynthesis protein A